MLSIIIIIIIIIIICKAIWHGVFTIAISFFTLLLWITKMEFLIIFHQILKHFFLYTIKPYLESSFIFFLSKDWIASHVTEKQYTSNISDAFKFFGEVLFPPIFFYYKEINFLFDLELAWQCGCGYFSNNFLCRNTFQWFFLFFKNYF